MRSDNLKEQLENLLYGGYNYPYVSRLAEIDPKVVEEIVNYLGKGEYNMAAVAIQRIKLPPNDAVLGLASNILFGICQYVYGDYGMADRAFQKADTILLATKLSTSDLASAAVYHGRALLYEASESYVTAAEDMLKAIEFSKVAGDGRGTATAQKNLGRIYLKQNKQNLAVVEFQNAMTYYMRNDFDFAEADCLRDIGFASSATGKAGEGVLYLEMALAMYATQNRPYAVVSAMCDLGSALIRTENIEQARLLLKEARDKAETLQYPRAMALALTLLGDMARDTGDLTESLGRYEEALLIYHKLDLIAESALQTANVGYILLQLGRQEEGITWLKRARELFVEAGDSVKVSEIENFLTG